MNVPNRLDLAGLEAIYDRLAETLDSIPPEKQKIFLVKLSLLSAEALGNTAAFLELIRQAAVLEE
ncbi:hypothetical protein [Neisseria leonii]|uniref:hypothetical protein n=1 Tax=Neisseria leonii TaxID=2995413 RepID=UPI00237A74EA|nr:hypothetical protein [Neisseria sp. 3986]MDD9326303.1 hypothetical protein [Neisseria sp. 3986]